MINLLINWRMGMGETTMDYHELAEELLDLRISRQALLHERYLARELRGEMSVLDCLHRNGDRAYPKKLSDEVVVSTARIAVILNRLEEEGYIRRIPDQEDSRKTVVVLDEKGKQFLEACRARIENYLAGILERMGEEDGRELLRLKQKMMRVMAES